MYFACFYGVMLPGAIAVANFYPSVIDIWFAIGVGLFISASAFAAVVFWQPFEQLAVEAMRHSGGEKSENFVQAC